MKIRARAPNRIDFAGGTLDIYPLYLFEGEGLTVNMAIDVRSRVEIETTSQESIVLHSHDLNQTVEAAHVDALELGKELDLLARAVRFYRPSGGIRVTTENQAPRGSGLGASSALLMALSGSLARLVGTRLFGDNMIDWGANLEAQNLKIPTGKQDYYAAVYGGVSAIHFGIKGVRREAIPLDATFGRELEECLILSFTGISHFSGTNNWNMMKRYIDSDSNTVECLRAIKKTAYQMREAFLARDVALIAACLAQEWAHRKRLAEGVTTPEIDRMMAAAEGAGAHSSKICGAGGGGCMVTVARKGERQAVEEALMSAGARILPFKIDADGLVVEALQTSRTAPHAADMKDVRQREA